MKKVKDTLPEKGHRIQTYLSSEKLRVLMKPNKDDLSAGERGEYLLLFLVALVSAVAVVTLLTLLNADPQVITLLHTCLKRVFTVVSTWTGN